MGKDALIVGYVMKPSREEDFSKVILSGKYCYKYCGSGEYY